ncbi:DUF2183 domain-containing protein [Deinococcus sp. HMF7620]|uniref:DUF2183 domain-containing protein n=1 Tax=Deinococcus arboris TaxID=2682977 RepID=A0A7C9LR60_9DEIO|nr:phosphatase domain-containing protein [Deinococcus arboris]MVN89136.1 DUF2183 domain-containing protein [Deinococcus arboris]
MVSGRPWAWRRRLSVVICSGVLWWSGAQAAQITFLASPDPAHLRLRVSQDDALAEQREQPSDSVLLNVVRHLAQLFPTSQPGVSVACQRPGHEPVFTVTDQQGYATCIFPTAVRTPVAVTVGLAAPVQVALAHWTAAQHITVSDVDDTILITDVVGGHVLQNVLTTNGTTRPLFADAPALLQGLALRGPVLYLSNSPDGLLHSLQTVLDTHHLPQGPLFLRDFLRVPALLHKVTVLETLARTTTARFTLIGDDGQQDPEVYSRFIQVHPGRVERLLIRQVSAPERRQEVERLLSRLGLPVAYLPPQ